METILVKQHAVHANIIEWEVVSGWWASDLYQASMETWKMMQRVNHAIEIWVTVHPNAYPQEAVESYSIPRFPIHFRGFYLMQPSYPHPALAKFAEMIFTATLYPIFWIDQNHRQSCFTDSRIAERS